MVSGGNEPIEDGIMGFGIITGKYLFTLKERVKNLRKGFSEKLGG